MPTGYGYVLPDQNGWSRYLHFQAAWVAGPDRLTVHNLRLVTGHLRKNLLPGKADLSWRALSNAIANHLRFKRPSEAEAWSYNVLQRLTYLFVIFVLFPLVIWTGLAMSPAFVSAFPATVTVFGGQQSARTIHFFVSLFLVLFLLVHVVMVCLAGFRSRMRAMITGRAGTDYGAHMSDLSRRKLITTGLAATAGVSGLGAAARIAQKYGLVPPDHGGIYGLGRNADLCFAAAADEALACPRVPSQPDFEASVRERNRTPE